MLFLFKTVILVTCPLRSDLETWASFIVWLNHGGGGGVTDLEEPHSQSVAGWLMTIEMKHVEVCGGPRTRMGAGKCGVLGHGRSRFVYEKMLICLSYCVIQPGEIA